MERIIDEASEISRKYGSADLDYIARRLGVEVHEELRAKNLKEVYFPELQAIVLRPQLPRHERNYLLAHAIGHHLFHKSSAILQASGSQEELACGSIGMGRFGMSRTEKEADAFAAFLLVPDTKLKPVLHQDWIDETDDPVLKLALEFQVPVELMRERLIFEGLRS